MTSNKRMADFDGPKVVTMVVVPTRHVQNKDRGQETCPRAR